MKKIIIAIGGGDLKTKTTRNIDEYISKLAKIHAGDKRAYGLFIGTASHDCMPAFNSFRKTYTSDYDIKADCALTVYNAMDKEKIKEKFLKADFIYVGGGDTLFMLNKWKESGLLDMILDAYNRGVIITGRSAGAICWFSDMYTDSESLNGKEGKYSLYKGLNLIKGLCSPHYNIRIKDFDNTILKENIKTAYAIEDNAALIIENGIVKGSIKSGGKSYFIENSDGKLIKTEI